MHKILSGLLLATAASLSLGACKTVRGVGEDIVSVADALAYDPARTYAACGTYGPIDKNGDGRISQAEYNDWRAAAYAMWDTNHDGRISRAEYANCWYGGGFYPAYTRANYAPSWTVWDTNGDGYLSADEYWNAQYWSRLDKNGDGVIDSSEWPW